MSLLERLLSRMHAQPGAQSPKLARRRRARVRDAEVLFAVAPGGDPLTGLRRRGEGSSVAAEIGPVTLVALVQQEETSGLVLRGQVMPAHLASGGIVHVRHAEREPILALIAEDGSFGVAGLRGTPTEVVVEIDDACGRLEWPGGRGPA